VRLRLVKTGVTLTKTFNRYFDKCLDFGEKYENEFEEIFHKQKVEVKTDRRCQETGNVFVEYQSRGKDSGIKTTKADYWVFCLWRPDKKKHTWVILPTIKLKRIIRKNNYRTIAGGDNRTSLGYLVPKEDLLKFQ
jgi:hypothetical protein